MNVTLVQCPAWTNESPPYALALLSAALKKQGHKVICFDLNIELYKFCKANTNPGNSSINADSWLMDFRGSVWYEKEKVLDFINKNQFYINKLVDLIVNTPSRAIGFSVHSTSKFFNLEVARRVKEKDKNKIIIFGGPLCFRNCYGIDILKDYPFLDFVCFGEGEESFPSLINDIEKKGYVESCPGFGWRNKDGTIIDGGDARIIEDLDKLSFADYSEFILEKYTRNLLPISTSRGCVNRCTFCNESAHWQRYRARTAQNIFEEINHQLNRYPKTDFFWFNDSLINGNMKMLIELSDLLIANRIRIKWGGQTMIRKEMTREVLDKIKSAGCSVISYGVENGSKKVLNLMRKGYTPELAEKVIRDTNKAGIGTIFNIIIGFPGEQEYEFAENKEFILRCKNSAGYIALNMCLILKGSHLYENQDEYNINADYNSQDLQLKWKTSDNQNTYDIRKRRLEELMEIIKDKTFCAFY